VFFITKPAGSKVIYKIFLLNGDMSDECQKSLIDSTTAVTNEQLSGHVVSQATREHAITEETFSVGSVPGLRNEDPPQSTR
jgi:hypothetical protein